MLADTQQGVSVRAGGSARESAVSEASNSSHDADGRAYQILIRRYIGIQNIGEKKK